MVCEKMTARRWKKWGMCLLLNLAMAGQAQAGDRLLATGGVSQVEGSGGGGLVPWALISGYSTDQQVSATGFYTEARTRGGFDLNVVGVSVGIANRLELSLSQQHFGLGSTVHGETIRMNTAGIKLRLFGDAVYDQDRWWPQVAVGMHLKHNEDFDRIPAALGAKHASGADFYVAATKLYLDAVGGHNLLLGATLQATKANQFGLLGFGGDRHDNYRAQLGVSAAVMLTDRTLLGAEYRSKPNNLSVYREDDAKDIFLTWFAHRNFSITAAYLDLGRIADKDNQTGWYLSGQLGF